MGKRRYDVTKLKLLLLKIHRIHLCALRHRAPLQWVNCMLHYIIVEQCARISTFLYGPHCWWISRWQRDDVLFQRWTMFVITLLQYVLSVHRCAQGKWATWDTYFDMWSSCGRRNSLTKMQLLEESASKLLPRNYRSQHYRLQHDQPLLWKMLWNYSSQTIVDAVHHTMQNTEAWITPGFKLLPLHKKRPYVKQNFPESSKYDFGVTLHCPPRCKGWL